MWEFFLLFIGLVLIYKSSLWVIKFSLEISKILKLGTFAIGFIFVALSTSMPEIFIAILSTLQGNAGLSVGNVLGSNLLNLTLVLGLIGLIGGTIYIKQNEIVELVQLLFISSLIPIFILQIGKLTFLHGIILLILFLFFLRKISGAEEKAGPKKRFGLIGASGKFFLSVGLLLIASGVVVRSSLEIVNIFNLTSELIGLIIVAFGTSLPELSVGLSSMKKGEHELVLGNLFGSCITNITLVLGITAILNPIAIDLVSIGAVIPILLLATVSVWFFLDRDHKLEKLEFLALLLIYGIFIVEELGIVVLG